MGCSVYFSQNAYAFFEDDEARRHILDLREKKADKSSLIDLESQNEALRQEITDLRGQIEIITQKVSEIEGRQKDFYVDLDERLKRLEGPQKETSASQQNPKKESNNQVESTSEPNTEEIDFNLAESKFHNANYKEAIVGYSQFIQKYPKSSRLAIAYYQRGNAYYLQKDYKNAYSNQNMLIKRFPRSSIAPDAMLNMASSQIGLNNIKGAKATLTDLIQNYPSSNAAKRAKGILPQL